MRTAARSLVETFHGVVGRMIAALREQRAIEAQRVLRRYGHLLEAPHETRPLSEINFVCNKEEFPENAHRSDACERAAGHTTFERA